MKSNTGRWVSVIIGSLLILVFGGGALFIVFLFASLGMTPLYVTKVIPYAGISALLVLLILNTGLLTQKNRKRLLALFGCVLLVCGAYIGYGAWRDSIPVVDDNRAELLYQYRPFKEDTLAITPKDPATLQLEGALLPKLDGATALYPVYASFVQSVYPEGEYGTYFTSCTGTIAAYERLINREVDVIFAAAPSEAQLKAAEKAGIELHMTPIGKEAFVFFVNSENPVTGLSVEQIQGIYTGEITNWKELGGRFQRIRPFQRAQDSGSQSALERLMNGLPLMEPEEEDRIAGMGGIIRQVADYRNYKNAIGFSFRFYSTEMVKNEDIRLLALNGVEPTRETIQDESYPISSYFYAITASPVGTPPPEDTNPKIAALLDWILSPQGQEIVDRIGYVSLD